MFARGLPARPLLFRDILDCETLGAILGKADVEEG
jgi:hypothetical protein